MVFTATVRETAPPIRIKRPDNMGMIVPIAFLYPYGRNTNIFNHLPECRAIAPHKPTVKNRMGPQARQRRLFKSAGVYPPVKFHHRTKGGIVHKPDGIGEKVEGRGLPVQLYPSRAVQRGVPWQRDAPVIRRTGSGGSGSGR